MPPKKDDTIKLPSRYATLVVSTLLSGAIAFNAWAVTAVYARPTRGEVTEMIEYKSPYAVDRNMILATLKDIRDELKELKTLMRERNGAGPKP